MLLQDREELLFHAPIDGTIVALVDSGLDKAVGLADVDEFLQQLGLEIRDTELEEVSFVLVAFFVDGAGRTFLNFPALFRSLNVSACSFNGVAKSGKWIWRVLTWSTPMRCRLVLMDFSIAPLPNSPRWSGDRVRILVSIVKPWVAALVSPSSSSERPGEVGGYLPAVSRWVILFSLRQSRTSCTSSRLTKFMPNKAVPNMSLGEPILVIVVVVVATGGC